MVLVYFPNVAPMRQSLQLDLSKIKIYASTFFSKTFNTLHKQWPPCVVWTTTLPFKWQGSGVFTPFHYQRNKTLNSAMPDANCKKQIHCMFTDPMWSWAMMMQHDGETVKELHEKKLIPLQ